VKRVILAVAVFFIAISLSGCVFGKGSPTISGTLIYSSKPVLFAEVTLTAYEDKDCVKLAESATSELNSPERQRLEECSSEYATTTTNGEGEYEFSDLESGWYRVSFTWPLDGEPDSTVPIEIVNGFLVTYYQGETAIRSNQIFGFAQYTEIVHFTGLKNIVIDFEN
jgi:hypothetical protein